MLSVMPVVTGHTIIPPGVVGGFPVLLHKFVSVQIIPFKAFFTCFTDVMLFAMLLHLCGFTKG